MDLNYKVAPLIFCHFWRSILHDMKHVGIEIDTFKKQIDVNFIDLDSNLVDLNYKVASLIFCHFWRSESPGDIRIVKGIIVYLTKSCLISYGRKHGG